MNVCMLSYSFYESDTRILQYTKALRERGDQVDVIALRRDGGAEFEFLNGVNVYRIQSRSVNEKGRFAYLFRVLRFLFWSTVVLTRKHFARRYDVIHVHSVPDFLVFAAVIPKLMDARVILDIHDILPEFYASKFQSSQQSLLFKSLVLVEKASAAFADHVIVANHIWCERLLRRSVGAGKCTPIPNYPDPEYFYQRKTHKTGKVFTILYPGTLNSHQGLDIAIRAFARVADQIPETEFHIYGEGPAKSALQDLTRQLGLTERVLFHDFRPIEKIAEIMSEADLAVVPKRASSGFGNEAASTKVAEFMALGVPLIVSRTKVDTYYHDDSMVMFFESEDEKQLSDCIVLMRHDAELRARYVRNGLRYSRQNAWESKKADYLNIVDSFTLRLKPTVVASQC